MIDLYVTLEFPEYFLRKKYEISKSICLAHLFHTSSQPRKRSLKKERNKYQKKSQKHIFEAHVHIRAYWIDTIRNIGD